MKLEWNKTVQTTVLAVLLVVTVPIVYIALFTAGVVNKVNKSQIAGTQMTGYISQKECEDKTKSTCEIVVTESTDQYWVETAGD